MTFLWLISRVAFDSQRIAKITGFAMFILVTRREKSRWDS
jgi:hypothetical protein